MNGRPWTEADDFRILDTPHLAAWEVGEMLGRSENAIRKRRDKLRGREGIERFEVPGVKKGQHLEPWKVGTRPLVARTCIACDMLLDSTWFRRQRDGRWKPECRRCVRTDRHVRDRSHALQLQTITADRATRHRQPITDQDLTIFSSDRSLLGMALATGRSITAVASARSKLGIATRAVRLADPAEVQWIIRFPEKVSA